MYIVAKANQTAMAFVARCEKERDGWIISYRVDSYILACRLRDTMNSGAGSKTGDATEPGFPVGDKFSGPRLITKAVA